MNQLSQTPLAGAIDRWICNLMNRKKPIVVVKKSEIAGKGLFANRGIFKGELIIEYAGRKLKLKMSGNYNSTEITLMQLEPGVVIDPRINGNSARYINHSCNPNCESVTSNGKVFIYATQNIKKGSELTNDYNLHIDEKPTSIELDDFRCFCRSKRCRGFMLSSHMIEKFID